MTDKSPRGALDFIRSNSKIEFLRINSKNNSNALDTSSEYIPFPFKNINPDYRTVHKRLQDLEIEYGSLFNSFTDLREEVNLKQRRINGLQEQVLLLNNDNLGFKDLFYEMSEKINTNQQ